MLLKSVAKLLDKHLWRRFFLKNLQDDALRFYWKDSSFIMSGFLNILLKFKNTYMVDRLLLCLLLLWMASIKRDAILRYEWYPLVFSSQFSLIASTLSLGIDNMNYFWLYKNHGKKSILKTKTYVFLWRP